MRLLSKYASTNSIEQVVLKVICIPVVNSSRPNKDSATITHTNRTTVSYMKSATHCGRVGGVDIQKETVFGLYAIGCTRRNLAVFADLLEGESGYIILTWHLYYEGI